MKARFHIIMLFFLLLSAIPSRATHLIGGYFEYACTGLNAGGLITYDLTLYLYVDCGPNANPIIEDAAFTIFNGNNNLEVLSSTMPKVIDSIIPDDINNPCVVSGPNICVREEIYKTSLILDPTRPHIVTYQRCCRNASIANVIQPDDQGSTISTLIPTFNTVGCNSTPVFNEFPPISICSGYDVNLDLSAVDADGDSLVYTFCSPLNYSSMFNPRPVPANAPPYSNIPFLPPFTANNPLPASPALSINSQTGRLNGVPTSIGQYVMGYCVEEYRNGVLIGTTRRAIQVNTGNCNPVINTAVQDQLQFCDGLTVQFRNQSTANVNIQNYKWDFGVSNLLDDTSRAFEPQYTYPDTGGYIITLIANPDLPCSDTSTEFFQVNELLSPQLNFDGKACLDSNSLTFTPGGIFEPYASFEWDFGSAGSISSSNLDTVRDVRFTGSGQFPVQLIVSQDNCSDTLNQLVTLFPNPVPNFSYNPNAGCYPLAVSMTNLSTFSDTATFIWDFGDGDSASGFSANHVYTANGYYDLALTIQTSTLCKDTVTLKIDSAIKVSLDSTKNRISFSIEPPNACPGTPIQFIDSSFYEGSADYFWDFGNNELSTDQNPVYVYQDTGYYDVGLLLITKDKCVDTLVLAFDSAIRILPEPISVLSLSKNEAPLKEASLTIDGSLSRFKSKANILINGVSQGDFNLLEYTFRDTGHYEIAYVTENEFGCKDTAIATFYVFDEFEFLIPNVFTPNGDGVNDQFEIRACGVYEYSIDIYNRYGKIVFQSNSLGYNWNGRIEETKASAGVYFYKINIKDFRGEYKTYTGNLTLLE